MMSPACHDGHTGCLGTFENHTDGYGTGLFEVICDCACHATAQWVLEFSTSVNDWQYLEDYSNRQLWALTAALEEIRRERINDQANGMFGAIIYRVRNPFTKRQIVIA